MAKKRINLTIEEDLYKYLKRNRKNVSSYIEKLVMKDLAGNGSKSAKSTLNRVSGSNPSEPINISSSLDEKKVQRHEYTHENNENHAHIIVFPEDSDFYQWAKMKYSKGYYNHIKSYYSRRLEGKTFKSPLSLQSYINKLETGVNNTIKTARVYLNYAEQFNLLSKDVIETYRGILKAKRSSKDYYVPSDEEIVENYDLIKDHTKLELVYLVLATSGIRITECVEFLKNYDEDKFEVHDDYVCYNVSQLRHNKNINNIYLPKFVYNKLQHIKGTYQSIRIHFHKRGCDFSLKYLRKWHYNFMIYNKVPESVADFIQGRSNQSVAANHYLAKSQQAKHWYKKIVSELEKLFTC